MLILFTFKCHRKYSSINNFRLGIRFCNWCTFHIPVLYISHWHVRSFSLWARFRKTAKHRFFGNDRKTDALSVRKHVYPNNYKPNTIIIRCSNVYICKIFSQNKCIEFDGACCEVLTLNVYSFQLNPLEKSLKQYYDALFRNTT